LLNSFPEEVQQNERAVAGLLVSREAAEFVVRRLQVDLKSSGNRADFVDAALMSGTNDFLGLVRRAEALQAFVETAEGRDLLAGYKRAANILKKEDWASSVRVERSRDTPSSAAENPSTESVASAREGFSTSLEANASHQKTLSYTALPEEASLIAALDSAEPRARTAVEAEDFEGAMAALASLRAPVDAFFDKVTVNDPDPAKREARLNLLSRMRDAVHQVADFSRIEG
jgi:glycyl-tRNA synthetase beta chain